MLYCLHDRLDDAVIKISNTFELRQALLKTISKALLLSLTT